MVHHHVICVFKKFMFLHVVLCQFSLSCYECSCCMFKFVSLFIFQIIYFPCCICCIFLYMLYLVLLAVLVISYQIFCIHGTLTKWLSHVWFFLCRTLISLVLYVCQMRWNLCNNMGGHKHFVYVRPANMYRFSLNH